ncbi:hypothetical protein SAMN05216275_10578 [Streptosporangium canum]|uniref:Phage protein Gp19/Gp15/Gp42 n=1 Tax=Streptosporangium canum TaxID=324952 RepID=A0A1I3LBS4_9ACTN|nr:hypothetical protein [Streptosporangium canum]SFI81946.1 hypothetical protein SAMN05216275_10578 [Streptosporangium canum]
MLMSVADIEARTGQVYEDERLDQVNAYITDVTALVESFLGRTYDTATPPAAVRAVACLEVIRYLNTDPGIAADRVGDLSTNYAYGGSVVALSSDVKTALRPFKWRSGLGSIQVISHLVPPPAEGSPP